MRAVGGRGFGAGAFRVRRAREGRRVAARVHDAHAAQSATSARRTSTSSCGSRPVVDVYSEVINQGLHMGAALLPRKLQIGEPSFDRAIDRMAAAVSDELGALLRDLDTISYDLSMAPDKATATATLRLKGQTSWGAGNLASMAARAAAPPPMFWRLPASAICGGIRVSARGAPVYEAVRHTVSDLVDGWLQHDGMAAADRAAIKSCSTRSSSSTRRSSRGSARSPPEAPRETRAERRAGRRWPTRCRRRSSRRVGS